MIITVAMLKQMREEGLSFDAAIRVLEAGEPVKSSAAVRQKRYRDKRNERNVTRDVTEVPLKEDQNPSGTVLPDEASASSPVRQPLAEARSVWNEAAAKAGWPQIRSSSANRDRQLAARLRQHGLDGWKSTIVRARASPYLAGADPPSWFTFSWLIKSENFLKVSEGNYDRNRSRNQRPATSNWEAAYLANVGDGSGFG